MNAGKTTSFDQAIAAANFHLVKEEDFILFIDVKRARFSGIRPLPQRVKTDSGWEIIKEETPTPRESLTPEDLHHQPETEPAEPTRFSKQKLWERKLLDTSHLPKRYRITIRPHQTLSLLPPVARRKRGQYPVSGPGLLKMVRKPKKRTGPLRPTFAAAR